MALEIASRVSDLIAQNLREREVLQQRHNVRKSLVKRQHIGVGRIHELTVHAVEQRVRGLMSNNVLRKASKNGASGKLPARVVVISIEISKEKRDLLRRVIRVSLTQRMRINPQLRHVNRIVFRPLLGIANRPPQRLASQRVLKVVNG